MARSRVELDRILRATLGTSNVFFDPPESFKLQNRYPCIIYKFDGYAQRKADNKTYVGLKRYGLTYITQDADDPMPDILEELEYCHLNRNYASDGLFHHAYDIYF